jgi:hypothetical protein
MNRSHSPSRIRGREPNQFDWLMLLGSIATIGWIVLAH